MLLSGLYFRKSNEFFLTTLVIIEKSSNFATGKSYTTSSPETPPGLDRSNGTGL